MWNVPTQKQLSKIPKLYETESVPLKDKKIYMHFFIGGCDWYIAEYDQENDLFWGYANLGDSQMAEWGYISFAELKALKVRGFMEVDREIRWKVKKASEIQKIFPQEAECLTAAEREFEAA